LKFQNEGKAFRTWRSLVWEFANEKLELVFSGAGDQPNLQALLAALPALDLPE
jgi:muconolactone delta-isomerase